MVVAFVTGATRGIGREIVTVFAERGYRVYGCARTEAEVKGLRRLFTCDVRDLGGLRECAAQVLEAEGACDILVNNAGITRDKTLLRMAAEHWEEVLGVNLLGVHFATLAFLPLLQRSARGCIVNISSIVAERGAFGQTVYGGTKAGIIGYSRSCALEMVKHGIRVNTVIPGYIDTGMTQSMPESVKQKIIDDIPMKRLGAPREVAELVYFLSSELASYITGSAFEVTGGMR